MLANHVLDAKQAFVQPATMFAIQEQFGLSVWVKVVNVSSH